MGLAKAKYLIFYPENATDIACTTRLLDLVPVWLGAIMDEFYNKNKSSYWNLWKTDSQKRFKNCKGDEKKLFIEI